MKLAIFLLGASLLSSMDLQLHTQHGERLRLSELKGKTVIVTFWATWCSWCRSEIQVLDRLQAEHPERVKVVGVALDAQGWRTVTPFLKQHGIRFSVGLAPHINTAVPLTLVFDPEGRLIARYTEAVGERELRPLLRLAAQ